MPVFFLVGGYANLVGWQRAQAAGTSAGQFVAGRPLAQRLAVVGAVLVALFARVELAARRPRGRAAR